LDAAYFSGIIGHKKIKEKFVHLIETDRVPHAMIFAGPSGLGKTLMATAIASAMIGRPVLSNWEAHVGTSVIQDKADAYMLVPMKNVLKVEQFRELQEQIMLMGRADGKRVCIIDKVETMNKEFANRMLKTLEEPPQGVCFILITNQPDLLLPTIISRCAMITFEPVNDEEMRQGLEQRFGSTKKLDDAVLWGCGNVKTVLDLCEGVNIGGAERALNFLQIMATHTCPYAKWLTVSAGYDDAMTAEIFRWAEMFLRDMMVLRTGISREQIRLKQYEKNLLELLPYWSDESIFKAMEILDKGNEAILRHINLRLVWDYVCIQFQHAKGGV
jgi:DNA polymerase-3 subunit delta'